MAGDHVHHAFLAAAGLVDMTPYDLRATHASWVADSHGVLVDARRFGHANANVTTRHHARALSTPATPRRPFTSTTSAGVRNGHGIVERKEMIFDQGA
ncbi:hypothetical protein OG777_17355 [Micromonospora peucetia]|uniref:hypothetical protein n=1 Tax=Micromonospora peucetia TaxID=47871 RepID=UPI00225764B4|nr:hypothetical protein [Micromonospora peucetia]MCX4388690.1 hypothetical protein [Micromonospora peucetia]